jgi:hypothetical protein
MSICRVCHVQHRLVQAGQAHVRLEASIEVTLRLRPHFGDRIHDIESIKSSSYPICWVSRTQQFAVVHCLTTMSASTDGADGHGSGMCSLSYFVQDGSTKLITCGSDGRLALRDADRPEDVSATALSASVLPMTCLAVHPNGTSVVVGHAAEGANFVKVAILLYEAHACMAAHCTTASHECLSADSAGVQAA